MAAIADDWQSARQIELVLPATVVCGPPAASKDAHEAPAVVACCSAASEREPVTDAA